MKSKELTIEISRSIGQVTGELLFGKEADSVCVLAHGAGAGMNHPFMDSLAEALANVNIGTLRYNFPFIEKGSRRPDVPAVAHQTVLRMIDVAREQFPGMPLIAGGKSFGGRMTSQAASSNPGLPVNGIVFVGFPLHPAGKPGIDRADHLQEVKFPMLFLQGTRDALAEISLVDQVCGSLPNAQLVKFNGADHSFRIGKRDLIPALAESVRGWFVGIAAKRR